MFDRYKNYKYRKAQERKNIEEQRLQWEKEVNTFTQDRYTFYDYMWKHGWKIDKAEIREKLGKRFFEVLDKEINYGIIIKHTDYSFDPFFYTINKCFEKSLLTKMIEWEERG